MNFEELKQRDGESMGDYLDRVSAGMGGRSDCECSSKYNGGTIGIQFMEGESAVVAVKRMGCHERKSFRKGSVFVIAYDDCGDAVMIHAGKNDDELVVSEGFDLEIGQAGGCFNLRLVPKD